MRTIINMLHEASTRFPNRAYATKKTDEGWSAYTYQEIDCQSDKVAAVLIANGCLEGCTFGLLAEGRPEWIISELGMMKARGLSVPLSIKLNPDEIAFRLNHSEAKGIFTSSNTLDNVIKALSMVEQKPMFITSIRCMNAWPQLSKKIIGSKEKIILYGIL